MNPSPGREERVAYAVLWTRCGEFAGRRVFFVPLGTDLFLYEKSSVETLGYFQSNRAKPKQIAKKAPFP